MEDKSLNIKSSTIEKTLDLAKDFLGKLIFPAVEEVGLLVSDNIKYLRFKNQINILMRARKYVEEKKINLKEIPVKILVPLLENASLEEDSLLQDKWASMIANMADSTKNFQNQIFPYILSQISIEEFDKLKNLINDEIYYTTQRKELASKLASGESSYFSSPETKKLQDEVTEIEQNGFLLMLEEFEQANLVRLGLVKQLPPKIYIQEFKTGGEDRYREKWHQIEAEYDTSDFGYRVTELGVLFVEACETHHNEASR